MSPRPSSLRPAPRRARPLLLLALAAGVLWLGVRYARLPSAEPLASRAPGETSLMAQRALEAREAGQPARRRQHWVALRRVAPVALSAVVAAEDAAFYQHQGVDTHELRRALEDSWEQGRLTRGASTITQQLAKNLWLSSDRSLLRKLEELVLARRLEEALSKERILELYVNVVEWGPGVWGIEAAAREHFGVSAAALTPAQGIILAAMLPAPRRWLPARRPPALHRRAQLLLARLERQGRLSPAEASAARAELEARLAPRRALPTAAAAAHAPGASR